MVDSCDRPTDDRVMWTTWMSGQSLLALLGAYRTGLLDSLAENTVDINAFAAAKSLDSRVLSALVLVLDRLGIVRRTADEVALTPEVRGIVLTWLPMFDLMDDDCRLSTNLLRALRGGSVRPVWNAVAVTPELARRHLAGMHAHSLFSARRLAENTCFEGSRWLLDVGGGSGCYAQELVSRHPDLRIDVAELDIFAPYVTEFIEQKELSRIRVIATRFGSDVLPRQYDRVLMSNFLHDHDRNAIIAFFRAAGSCLVEDGRIVLHEVLTDDPSVSLEAAQLSLHLATWTAGRQYGLDEFSEMLGAAGFRITDVTRSGALHSVVVAERAQEET